LATQPSARERSPKGSWIRFSWKGVINPRGRRFTPQPFGNVPRVDGLDDGWARLSQRESVLVDNGAPGVLPDTQERSIALGAHLELSPDSLVSDEVARLSGQGTVSVLGVSDRHRPPRPDDRADELVLVRPWHDAA